MSLPRPSESSAAFLRWARSKLPSDAYETLFDGLLADADGFALSLDAEPDRVLDSAQAVILGTHLPDPRAEAALRRWLANGSADVTAESIARRVPPLLSDEFTRLSETHEYALRCVDDPNANVAPRRPLRRAALEDTKITACSLFSAIAFDRQSWTTCAQAFAGRLAAAGAGLKPLAPGVVVEHGEDGQTRRLSHLTAAFALDNPKAASLVADIARQRHSREEYAGELRSALDAKINTLLNGDLVSVSDVAALEPWLAVAAAHGVIPSEAVLRRPRYLRTDAVVERVDLLSAAGPVEYGGPLPVCFAGWLAAHGYVQALEELQRVGVGLDVPPTALQSFGILHGAAYSLSADVLRLAVESGAETQALTSTYTPQDVAETRSGQSGVHTFNAMLASCRAGRFLLETVHAPSPALPS